MEYKIVAGKYKHLYDDTSFEERRHKGIDESIKIHMEDYSPIVVGKSKDIEAFFESVDLNISPQASKRLVKRLEKEYPSVFARKAD